MLLSIQNNCDCDGFASWLPWLFGAFILGTIFGWLLSKILSTGNSQSDYDSLKAELAACRKGKPSTKIPLAGASSFTKTSTKKSVKTPPSKSSATKKTAPAAIASVTKKDDLTKVEGIGPKIKGLLNDDGIWTWKKLSETKPSHIKKILDKAGPRYKVHNPGSWPKQAGMAARGEWDKLKKWQDSHKGGLE